MKRIWLVAIAVVVVAALGGGAFWAGTRVGENRALADPARFFQQQRANRLAGQFPGLEGLAGAPLAEGQERPGALVRAGGGTMGTVEAVEGEILVVNTNDGTVRVQTADTTLVEKYVSVGVGELEVGERVMISGSTNEDGTLIARSIQSLRALPTEATIQE